jgi:hypothetical protein
VTKEEHLREIEKELGAARTALERGNHGMVRVSARRAAGRALAWFLDARPQEDWGPDTMSRLTRLRLDPSFPEDVRAAALRLTTKITENFSYTSASSPLEDARRIIEYVRETLSALPH